MFLAVGADGFGERQGLVADGGVDHPQVQGTAQLALEGGGVLLEAFEFAQQTQGFLMEQLALAGQAETATAAMAQHQAKGCFELAHVGADGRRREIELLLGVGEPLMAHHADEDAQ
ncbi:hypothetical protein D3C85_1224730 [compost metagenome]